MKVVVKKLADLKPMEKNIRRHSPKQITEYVRSLRMFGQVKPLVVDENGTILIGNGLYEALLSMGEEKADCYVMAELSEKDKKKLMLADNRVYELGMTDTDVFDEIIKSLEGDVDVPGWDAELLETLNASIQEVNEMVDTYGSYQPEEIARYNGRRPAEVGSGELQQPSAAPEPHGEAETYPTAQTAGDAPRTASARYIICPKCGERIEIGGV